MSKLSYIVSQQAILFLQKIPGHGDSSSFSRKIKCLSTVTLLSQMLIHKMLLFADRSSRSDLLLLLYLIYSIMMSYLRLAICLFFNHCPFKCWPRKQAMPGPDFLKLFLKVTKARTEKCFGYLRYGKEWLFSCRKGG